MIENLGINSNSLLEDISIESRKTIQESEVEQDRNQFLELMIAQLENQNPLDPKDGGDFLAQLAQFSTVEGIEKLNGSMADLASGFRSGQALQATALVGRAVEVPQSITELGPNQGLSGSVELPVSTSNVTLRFSNEAGELVKELKLGPYGAGQVAFDWNGLDNAGQQVPPGFYFVEALAQQEEEDLALTTFVSRNVESVTLDSGGDVTVNVDGLGGVPLSDVRSIR